MTNFYSTQFIIFILLLLIATLGHAQQPILIIHSYHESYPWVVDYSEAIQENLGADFSIKNFYLDTKRIRKDQFTQKAKDAWDYYKKGNYGLIVLADDNAMNLLATRFSTESLPVIFLGINNNPRHYFPSKVMSNNFSGVLERPLIKRSIAHINYLDPNIKRILVLLDSGMTSNIIFNEIFLQKQFQSISNIDVEVILVDTFMQWKNIIFQSSLSYDAIVVGLYHTLKNEQNLYVDSESVLAWTSKQSTLPLFGFWDFAVGADKTLGGLVLTGEEQGRLAAEMVDKVLSDEKLLRIPIVSAHQGQFMYSREKLDQYGLSIPSEMQSMAIFVD